MTRAALVLLLAAATGWVGLVVPARRARDRARSDFARARQERERLRAEVALVQRRGQAEPAPKDAAEAARALRRSYLRATEGLPVRGVQIAVAGAGGGSGAQGSLVADGRLADLLRLAERLVDPAASVRVERVSLTELRGAAGRPAHIEIQGRGAGGGS